MEFTCGFLPVDPCRKEATQRLVQAGERALARVVRIEHGHVLLVAQDILSERREHALGADLDKYARALAVQRLHTLDKLYWRGDVPAQDVDDLSRAGRIQFARDVGDDGQARWANAHPGNDLLEWPSRRGDDPGVECVGDRDLDRAIVGSLKGNDRVVDRLGRPANDHLVAAVDIGQYHITDYGGENAFHLFQRCKDGGHTTIVVHRYLAHLAPARADDEQRIGKGQHASGDQCRILAQAVTDDEVGHDPITRQEPGQGDFDRQHSRLGDLGVAQLVLCHLEGRLVRCVHKDVLGERTVEQRGHHLVGLAERLRHDWIQIAQFAQHVDILRTLAWIHKGYLAGFTAAAKHALRREWFPYRGITIFKGTLGLETSLAEFLGISKVDRQPLGSGHVVGARQLRRHAPCLCVAQGRLETCLQPRDIGGTQHQRAAIECFGLSLDSGWDGGLEHPFLRGEQTGNVLLDDDVEIGSPKAERADPGRAHPVPSAGLVPRAEFGVDIERRAAKVDVGIGPVKVDRGRQHLVVQGQHRLEQPRGPGRALEVANVRLDRSERDAAGRQIALGERQAHAL